MMNSAPPTTQAEPARPSRGAAVLDYARAPESATSRWRRRLRELGPWIVWPSRRSWLWLALLVAAAVNIAWLPRRWQLIDDFEARDDSPVILRGTSRIMYRAPDYTLWVRDLSGGTTRPATQIQLEPSPTHTEPTAAADGKLIVRWRDDGDLLFWDGVSGRQVGRTPAAAFTHDGETPEKLALSWDGTRAAARYKSGQLAIWDLTSTPQPKRLVAHKPAPTLEWAYGDPAFSADGRHVLVSSGKSVWLGETRTLRQKIALVHPYYGEMYASWSDDGRRLLVAEYLRPREGQKGTKGHHWRMRVIDPDDPNNPVTRDGYRDPYPQNAFVAADGRAVMVAGTALYDLPFGGVLARVRDPFYISAILPGNRLVLQENYESRFAHVVDIANGAVIARVPSALEHSVLPDGRTMIARDYDKRVRVRRLGLDGAPERSAWWSWRVWLMALPAGLLTASLWRDARRRSRPNAPPPRRFDACATGMMIAAGVAALAFGMAQTAVDRSFYADAWWSGGFVGACVLVIAICATGVLAGSRGWLWITRALLLLFALIALAATTPNSSEYENLIMLDHLWVMPPAMMRTMFGVCAAALLTLAILLGRRPRTVRPA